MNTPATPSEKPSSLGPLWVTASIKRFLMTIAESVIFATRDLLSLGSRTAIDSALSRLVASGRIVRLAWGLFMKVKTNDPDWRPQIEAVAQAKLLAFRRVGGAALEAQSALECNTSSAHTDQTVTYQVAGNRSKFRLFDGTVINVKAVSNRKLDLAQSKLGARLKNLWQSVERLCEESALAFVRSLGREEKADVKALLPLLPQRLSDFLGAPWNHKPEVFPISHIPDECSKLEWFSLEAIRQSRTLRTMKRPPPVFESNY